MSEKTEQYAGLAGMVDGWVKGSMIRFEAAAAKASKLDGMRSDIEDLAAARCVAVVAQQVQTYRDSWKVNHPEETADEAAAIVLKGMIENMTRFSPYDTRSSRSTSVFSNAMEDLEHDMKMRVVQNLARMIGEIL